MQVHVTRVREELSAVLVEADDFRHFAVRVASDIEVRSGVTSSDGAVRFTSGDQSWVDQEWLRSAGSYVDGSAAGEAFETMIATAVRGGWVDSETGDIAAHVERDS